MAPDMPATVASAWPDLSGRLDVTSSGLVHILPLRVYYEDTDFSGLVYHATYVRWCERGRSDYLRLAGNDHHALIKGNAGREPAAFVVRRMQLEYLKPARIDEVLEAHTRVIHLGAASLVLDQRILRENICIFEAAVTVVLVSQRGQVLRLSKALRSAIAP